MNAQTCCTLEKRRRIVRNTASFCLSLMLAAAAGGGCQREAAEEPAARMELTFDPSPPSVGRIGVTLTVATEEGAPVNGADVRLEGNMNHAGMTPSFAALDETEPGRYTGTLDFTMGGDWFVIVSVQMQDGRRLERKIDVPGVRAP
jgi:hypothetical protein